MNRRSFIASIAGAAAALVGIWLKPKPKPKPHPLLEGMVCYWDMKEEPYDDVPTRAVIGTRILTKEEIDMLWNAGDGLVLSDSSKWSAG